MVLFKSVSIVRCTASKPIRVGCMAQDLPPPCPHASMQCERDVGKFWGADCERKADGGSSVREAVGEWQNTAGSWLEVVCGRQCAGDSVMEVVCERQCEGGSVREAV